MKKLFILTTILFMAPTVGGITISLNDTGTTVELSVFGWNEPEPHCGIAMVIEAPGLLTNFIDTPKAPVVWTPYPVTINGDSGQRREIILPDCEDGVWLIADWSAPTPVWVSAYTKIAPGPGNDWILMDRIQVPEPATIALLTLGGLYLLRRRR